MLHLHVDKLVGAFVFLLQVLFLHLLFKVRGHLVAVDEKFPELILVESPFLQDLVEGFFLRLGFQVVFDLLHILVRLFGKGLIILHLGCDHPLTDQLFHQLLLRFVVIQQKGNVRLQELKDVQIQVQLPFRHLSALVFRYDLLAGGVQGLAQLRRHILGVIGLLRFIVPASGDHQGESQQNCRQDSRCPPLIVPHVAFPLSD